jgi:ABC-2 type transport system permease protein
MKNSWIIARRELMERIKSRSFLFMAFFGPIVVLGITYAIFKLGGKDQQKWNVLIADKGQLFENKIASREDPSITYSFINDYVEIADFATNEKYKDFDALVEINHKIISNKAALLFYKEKPSFNMSVNIRYQVERRLEEIVATEQYKLSLRDFRSIKQPLTIGFRNVYDPYNTAVDLAGWVGLFFGGFIFLFIFLFGMTILRAVLREKSSRIVEVLMATVSPRALLMGKIIGIGLSALLQLLIWLLLVTLGLYLFRQTIFIDFTDPSMVTAAMPSDYNQFVELVFDRINFVPMISVFAVFFVLGYLFYGAFFAALGAVSGSESDGQQFLIPLIALLLFALYSGYFVLMNPESSLAVVFHYLPFTSPVVVMVKFAMGYPLGSAYQLYLSAIILFVSAFLVLSLAGRLYKNGLLQYGHAVRLSTILRWLKRN